MTYSPVTLESLLTHQGWAMRIARRLVHEEAEAEDLVQRTWIAALRSPPQSETGARAWIRKVILNLARERHRRQQARTRHEQLREAPETDQGDLLDHLSRTEVHRLLGERLMKLEEPYRTVVLQRFYEDLTSVEIAQRLGIPAGTVRWRLKMGLDQLREELDRRSQGDRTRWVSALLALLPPGASLAKDAEDENEKESAAPATGSSASHVLGWTAAGALGVFGVLLFRSWDDSERGTAHAFADGPAPVSADVDPRLAATLARDENAPVPLGPAASPAAPAHTDRKSVV